MLVLNSGGYLFSLQVETIGDCYLAVCGLPTPRDEHAVGKSIKAISKNLTGMVLKCHLPLILESPISICSHDTFCVLLFDEDERFDKETKFNTRVSIISCVN